MRVIALSASSYRRKRLALNDDAVEILHVLAVNEGNRVRAARMEGAVLAASGGFISGER